MEVEKFNLGKRTIKYECGCEVEIFSFEQRTPSATCEKHGTPVLSEENQNDEL